MTQDVRANSVLPAARTGLTLRTSDGLALVGELAQPTDGDPVATIVFVHPLPTAGGMMDSHLVRKASWRLPALANVAVLRFNTRGTASAAGRSEGFFDAGDAEGLDVAAAVAEVLVRGLPTPWLVGWSFGTDVILKHPEVEPVLGAVLLSPPLRFTADADLDAWAATGRPVKALIPEFDDFLRPDEARARFGRILGAQVIAIEGGKHLWVGEPAVQRALNEIVQTVAPDQLDSVTSQLPTLWDGPMQKWSDL